MRMRMRILFTLFPYILIPIPDHIPDYLILFYTNTPTCMSIGVCVKVLFLNTIFFLFVSIYVPVTPTA